MKYPLLFGYRELIAGSGFIAVISTNGRFLLDEPEETDGEFWVYGVNPGGLAGGGMNRHEALQDFRHGYRSVLIDSATDATTFEAFKVEVHRIFDDVNRPMERLWDAAVAAVRKGEIDPDWVQKRRYEGRIGVTVELVTAASADVNGVDQPESVAA